MNQRSDVLRMAAGNVFITMALGMVSCRTVVNKQSHPLSLKSLASNIEMASEHVSSRLLQFSEEQVVARCEMTNALSCLMKSSRAGMDYIVIETFVYGGPGAETRYEWMIAIEESKSCSRMSEHDRTGVVAIDPKWWISIKQQFEQIASNRIAEYPVTDYDYIVLISFGNQDKCATVVGSSPWTVITHSMSHPDTANDICGALQTYLLLSILTDRDAAVRLKMTTRELKRCFGLYTPEQI